MKIAVIGTGMVGGQVASWFKDCLTYDTEKQSDTWDECLRADCFFLCLPTPYVEGKEYDLSYLEDTIAKIPDNKLIVLKSTLNPGTTDYFQDKYPNKLFMFSPEFLTELSAEDDFRRPDMQILGITHQSEHLATKVMLLLPPAPCMRIVSAVDAEWVKKIRNAYYATKVIFFNEVHDIVKAIPSSHYETIRSVIVEDPNVGNSHSFVKHKGYRGFGGKCLPKDLYSLIEFADKIGIEVDLLKRVKKINYKLHEDNSNRTQGLYRESSDEETGKNIQQCHGN
jgi:UDPglucose 6-dehydrogenase